MALQKTINTKYLDENISFENAYIKVEYVNSSKEKAEIVLQSKKTKNGIIVETKYIQFNPDNQKGENIIKQAYLHLKTLPEFSDAIDC